MKGSDIAARKRFASKSTPGKFYEAVCYGDGSTSCNCPGWTRRVERDGTRECKHTIEIARGITGARSRTESKGKRSVVSISVPAGTPVTVRASSSAKVTVSSTPQQPTQQGRRRFNWDD